MSSSCPLLASIRSRLPWLRHVFADGAYAGPKLEEALAALGRWRIEIVKRSDAAQGFPPPYSIASHRGSR